MTSSSEARVRNTPDLDALPSAFAALWRVTRLGFHYEPWLMGIAFGLAVLAALPDALLAVWLALLANGVLLQDPRQIAVAAAALALSAVGTWFLQVWSTRIQRRFRDRVTIALESHVARLQSSVVTIAHQERPEYLDRLSVLRDQVFVLDHMYLSLFSTCGWLLRLAVTIALLVGIDPALAFLPLCGLPLVVAAAWRPGVEQAVQERGSPARRRAAHLYTLATTAPPGKEVRVTGVADMLALERRAAWERWYQPVARVRWVSAAWHVLAWAIFGAAWVGGIVFVASGLHAPASEVLLVLAAGARLSMYIGGTVGEISFLRGVWLDGSVRLVWLEEYAAALAADADRPVPAVLQRGLRLEHVSFAYPGTDRLVLDDISLELPAGAVVAIVGENGAGKSTLVKLLGKFYEPSRGAILVDDEPLARLPAEAWRARLAGAFQDFFRFEFIAQQTVGVGDLARLDDRPAVSQAVERAGANDVVERLTAGLDTQLGPTWPNGVDVSFGQWQKLALARGFMRPEPLLLILDEPTAALDAETEHALFERYAAVAHAPANGRITVLVSHRFSTVRMADLIVVLDGARVVEIGSHDELVGRGGQYAELLGIQAAAYR